MRGRLYWALFIVVLFPSTSWAQAVQLTKLVDSDPTEHDHFGRSVSLSGNRALVGVPLDDDLGSSSGSAYVFERQRNGTWTQAAKLLASDGHMSSYFGTAVSLLGDRALVGTRGTNEIGSITGSAYVFERRGDGTWTQTAKLLSSDGWPGDYFGLSVSLSEDRALVGAFGDDDNFHDSGSAYVFERQGDGTWTQAAKLLASDGTFSDGFGYSVSLSGDRALVGAFKPIQKSGSAYVFEHQGDGAWKQVAKFLTSDGTSSDGFGSSVSLLRDRALVGAFGYHDLGSTTGAAYVFEPRGDGTWAQVAKLLASDGADGDSFGFPVSLSGNRALVGAFRDDDLGTFSGSAYVFERHGDGTWKQAAKLLASDGATGDYFGSAVSLSGDRALVGAYLDDDVYVDSGSAYVFSLRPLNSPTKQISLSSGGGQLLELEAGDLQQNQTYFLLGSLSGGSPGISLGGGWALPLNPDEYFLFTAAQPIGFLLQNSLGTLNESGNASAWFRLPAGLQPSLAGLTFHHAFAILKDGNVTFVGNAQALELVP